MFLLVVVVVVVVMLVMVLVLVLLPLSLAFLSRPVGVLCCPRGQPVAITSAALLSAAPKR